MFDDKVLARTGGIIDSASWRVDLAQPPEAGKG